jgi:hypothetical protein
MEGLGDFGVVNFRPDNRGVWTYGVADLCMRRGLAELQSIEPDRKVGPLRIEGWGVREAQNPGLGTRPGPMPDDFAPIKGYRVGQCDAPSPRAEVVVQIRRTGSGPSGIDGLRLTYRIGARTYQLESSLLLVLCDREHNAGDPALVAECQDAFDHDTPEPEPEPETRIY